MHSYARVENPVNAAQGGFDEACRKGRRHHRRRARHRPRDRRTLLSKRAHVSSSPTCCSTRPGRRPPSIGAGTWRSPSTSASANRSKRWRAESPTRSDRSTSWSTAPRLQHGAAGGNHRGGFRQAVRHQCSRACCSPLRSLPPHGRRRQGRQDHQLLQPGGPARRGACRGLLRGPRRRSSASRRAWGSN